MIIGHLLRSFLIELDHKRLLIRGHSQLFEALGQSVLTLVKGALPSQAHFVSKLALVVAVLGQPNTLQNAAAVGRHLVKLDVSFLRPTRLETLKQAIDAHLNFVLAFSRLLCHSSGEIDRGKASLLPEGIVRVLHVFLLRQILTDLLVQGEIFLIGDLFAAYLAIAQASLVYLGEGLLLLVPSGVVLHVFPG